MGLDQGGVGDQGEERAYVREGEEAVGNVASLFTEEPDLQEGTGRSEQKEGKADGQGEIEEDGGDGMGGALSEVRPQEVLGSQHRDGDDEKREVEKLLAAGEGALRQPVRVEVAEKQGELEEDQAGEPDCGRAFEGGEELLRRHGLDQEEEKGREEDGKAVERPG